MTIETTDWCFNTTEGDFYLKTVKDIKKDDWINLLKDIKKDHTIIEVKEIGTETIDLDNWDLLEYGELAPSSNYMPL